MSRISMAIILILALLPPYTSVEKDLPDGFIESDNTWLYLSIEQESDTFYFDAGIPGLFWGNYLMPNMDEKLIHADLLVSEQCSFNNKPESVYQREISGFYVIPDGGLSP